MLVKDQSRLKSQSLNFYYFFIILLCLYFLGKLCSLQKAKKIQIRAIALIVFGIFIRGCMYFTIYIIVYLMRTLSSGVISGILFKDCRSLVNYTIVSSVQSSENSIKSCVQDFSSLSPDSQHYPGRSCIYKSIVLEILLLQRKL